MRVNMCHESLEFCPYGMNLNRIVKDSFVCFRVSSCHKRLQGMKRDKASFVCLCARDEQNVNCSNVVNVPFYTNHSAICQQPLSSLLPQGTTK